MLIIKIQFRFDILSASNQQKLPHICRHITCIASKYFDFGKLDSVRFVKADCETKQYAYILNYKDVKD